MPICPECGKRDEVAGKQCPIDGSYFIRDHAWKVSRSEPLLGFCFGGNYALVDYLGKGMTGTVFEGLHVRLWRRCAIKVLRQDVQANTALRKRFKREAQSIAMLDHPNIVKIYDYDVEANHPYFAMEYIDSPMLSVHQPYAKISHAGALRIMTQILAALSEAHSVGIVHRDLKPDNIALSYKVGHPFLVKVLDFGLAKLVQAGDQNTQLTEAGEVLGTPLYMSPEQTTGSDITAASDIYAFGCIAYELLTGKPPFDAATPLATMMQHLHKAVPRMVPRNGVSLSDGIRYVIGECLAKEPSARYSSAREVLQALEATPELSALNIRHDDIVFSKSIS